MQPFAVRKLPHRAAYDIVCSSEIKTWESTY